MLPSILVFIFYYIVDRKILLLYNSKNLYNSIKLRQIKGIIKYVNTLLDSNPQNRDEIEEVNDTYSKAFSKAITYFKGSDNLKEYINKHVNTFNDIDTLDDWLEDKGFK